MYKKLRNLWKSPEKSLMRDRLIEWRRDPAILRIEKPTNISSARSIGYKAKEGFIMVRVRVIRGGRMRPQIKKGRRSKAARRKKIVGMSYQWIAEQRAQKFYKNLEVLNSYKVGKDGRHFWFEIILIDPQHPVIKKDRKLNMLGKKANKKRVTHGLTSAAKKSRGLNKKGKGAEKIRPSRRANKGRSK
ncbi:50S ribosomal protein L15e [Candidatus Woesearchaeota archaeon]|jgi:large subunit ribosomal protein L15e|nr:50S ribosomal protein L15e [Candidatus Woesearchaeota archaeon]MBT4322251.1 50S ribosomal protein L15e [Candidatus Woesearchaeota archaeon]MBT4631271.1 50S ribosomal protein L15e [Candidatus Woesearchaeota archaeon]